MYMYIYTYKSYVFMIVGERGLGPLRASAPPPAAAPAAPVRPRTRFATSHPAPEREIGNLLRNNRRQRRTCYALCHILYSVSAAHTSIFRMDSNSTSYHPAPDSQSARQSVSEAVSQQDRQSARQ